MNTVDTVQCSNLKFKKLYNRQQIDKEVDKIAAQVDQHFTNILKKQPDARFLILGVLNGAFMFTSELVRRLKTPVLVQFIKISSYKGMESGELSIDSRMQVSLFRGTHVLILDDICDTGKTLAQLSQIIKGMEVRSVQVGVMVIRPDKKQEITPDYFGLTCNAFIIGYGLDYNGDGRQYPEIYQKIDE